MADNFGDYISKLEECMAEIENLIADASVKLQQNEEKKAVLSKKREEELAKAKESAQLEYDNKSENNTRELEELNQMRNTVIKHGRIISNHTSARPNPAEADPIEPDLTYLKKAAFQIIDNDKKDDPMAAQLLATCAGYISFIEKRIELLQSGFMAKLSVTDYEQEVKDKFAAGVGEIVREEHEVKEYLSNRLCNKQLISLKELLSENYKHSFITLGYKAWKSSANDLTDSIFTREIPEYYSENSGTIQLPVLLKTDKATPVFVQWQPLSELHLSRMLQELCTSWIRLYGANNSEIYFLDQINRNARLLGALSIVVGEQGGAIKTAPVSDDDIHKTVDGLEKKISLIGRQHIDRALFEGEELTANKKTSHILVIINDGEGNSIDSTARGAIQRLIYNGSECGIQFLWAHQASGMDQAYKGDWIKSIEYQYPNSIRITDRLQENPGFVMLTEGKSEDFTFEERFDQITRDELTEFFHHDDSMQSMQTAYFERYPFKIPQRMKDSKEPIEVPIGIDENGTPVLMNFDGVNFATYIMGASGSGKSTLLHTIIAGLAMNYHPDEMELWLADFNKVEFSSYIRYPLPHIKNILLDDSRELVFDLIDQLIAELDYRLQYLSRHGVQDVKDLSSEDRLPAIVVIIDEFARMSDVLQHEFDYQKKMTRLLQTGRKPGLKFIFASQNYNNGIHGLRDEAKAQIQNRIALMNPNRGEMIGVLSMSMTDQVDTWIKELPAYCSIVKFADKQTGFSVRRIRNFYPSPTGDALEGMRQLSKFMQSEMTSVTGERVEDPKCYVEKNRLYLDGKVPRTFDEDLSRIEAYEKCHQDDLLPGDVRVYPGSPRGFYSVRFFKLIPKPYQNILITGAGGNNKNSERVYASLLASLTRSFRRVGYPVEVWSDDRDPVYYRYHDLWDGAEFFADEAAICGRISYLLEAVQNRVKQNRLVIILGYESLKQAFSVAGELKQPISSPEIVVPKLEFDLASLMAKDESGLFEDSDIEEYNNAVAQINNTVDAGQKEDAISDNKLYDASSDLEKLWAIAGNMGIHFVLCCPDPNMIERLRIRMDSFVHQILFDMPMSFLRGYVREKADLLNLEGAVGYYQENQEGYSFKAHLYSGVPLDGWCVKNGVVCEE